LNLHTMLSDGVATVRQSLGRGFERDLITSIDACGSRQGWHRPQDSL